MGISRETGRSRKIIIRCSQEARHETDQLPFVMLVVFVAFARRARFEKT